MTKPVELSISHHAITTISGRHCPSLSGGRGVAEEPRDAPCYTCNVGRATQRVVVFSYNIYFSQLNSTTFTFFNFWNHFICDVRIKASSTVYGPEAANPCARNIVAMVEWDSIEQLRCRLITVKPVGNMIDLSVYQRNYQMIWMYLECCRWSFTLATFEQLKK